MQEFPFEKSRLDTGCTEAGLLWSTKDVRFGNDHSRSSREHWQKAFELCHLINRLRAQREGDCSTQAHSSSKYSTLLQLVACSDIILTELLINNVRSPVIPMSSSSLARTICISQ